MAGRLSKKEVNPVRLPARRGEKQVEDFSGLGSLAGLHRVEVAVTLEWGRSQISLEQAMKLGKDSLLRLDQQADELVDVRVNGRLFARGKLVVVGDAYGVQLIEFVDS